MLSPAGTSWGPSTLVQSDVFVADLEQVRTLDWVRAQALLLGSEVLNSTTAGAGEPFSLELRERFRPI